jgi:hypothetical protein
LDRLLTTDEAATLLQKPPGTLVNWRYRSLGPKYVKVLGAIRYRQATRDSTVSSIVTPVG